MGSNKSCCSPESSSEVRKVVSESPTNGYSSQRKSTLEERSPKTGSRRATKSEPVRPENNILVQALFADFQESLRSTYKTRKDAFDKLGGSGDGIIDIDELNEVLAKLGYDNKNLNAQLFQLLDKDNSGSITRVEFKSVFQGETAELTEFKECLKEMFKSRGKAFDDVGGKDDGRIDQEEMVAFLKKHVGSDDDAARKLFKQIDADGSGYVSKGEFKALFQADGETATIIEFKDKLKTMFKSRKEAFDKLGGSDDAKIDKDEFNTFLSKELHYRDTEVCQQLFAVIDDDGDGFITKGEFEALFLRHTVKLVEVRDSLKELLRERFKSRQKAFDQLGGKDDGKIDRPEMRRFMRGVMNNDDEEENDQIFSWIDKDGNGFITLDEFKQFF